MDIKKQLLHLTQFYFISSCQLNTLDLDIPSANIRALIQAGENSPGLRIAFFFCFNYQEETQTTVLLSMAQQE